MTEDQDKPLHADEPADRASSPGPLSPSPSLSLAEAVKKRWAHMRNPFLPVAGTLLLLWAIGALGMGVAVLAATFLAIVFYIRAAPQAGAKPESIAVAATYPAAPGPVMPGVGAAIVDQLPDPLILLDKTGRILLRNKAAGQIIGANPVGRPIAAVLRVPDLLSAIEDVLAGAAHREINYRMPVPVERHYHAHVTQLTAPLMGPQSGEAAVLVLFHDVTADRRVEQMRADFVAYASHELKTPLASLSGFIDTLQGHAQDDPEAQARFLKIMSDQAGRMRRLIEDLLSLSRIELREHIRPQGSVDLKSLIADVVDGLAPVAASNEVEISVEAPHRLQPVRGDREELTQLFQNLVDNAVKYGRSGHKVTISMATTDQPGGPQALVTIQDFGPGIAREHLPRLTERFYRVDPAQSRERGGTGLGLAIVKHIVNRHEGVMFVDSELGEGSRFSVRLPFKSGAQDRPATPEPAQ